MVAQRPEEGIGFPGAVVMGSFELLGTKLGSFARAVCPNHRSLSVAPVTLLLPQMHSALHSETVLQAESFALTDCAEVLTPRDSAVEMEP